MALAHTEIFDINLPHEALRLPKGMILLGYRGSIAHGMYVPGTDPNSIDDVDLMGIAIAPEDCYFGLHEWGSRGTKELKQGKYDCVYYEVRKMFSLLLQGNPNVLSFLWMRRQEYLEMRVPGQKILECRELFIGKHVYNAFAGYAHAQLEKMELRDPDDLRMYLALTAEAKHRRIHPNHKGEKIAYPEDYDYLSGEARVAFATRDEKLLQMLQSYLKKGENIGYLGDKRKKLVLEHGYDAKNAAHCIRLLRMCKEFLNTGEMIVYRPDAQELLDIKLGRWSLEKVKEHSKQLFEEIREARDKSPLPEGPDREGAEKLLISIVRDSLYA